MYKINNIILFIILSGILGIFLFKQPKCKARIRKNTKNGFNSFNSFNGFNNTRGSIYTIIEGAVTGTELSGKEQCDKFIESGGYPSDADEDDCQEMYGYIKAYEKGKSSIGASA